MLQTAGTALPPTFLDYDVRLMASQTDVTGENGVAIIIPCYNQAAYLGEAIASALNQGVRPFEVIVVDDGSTDDTRRVAESFSAVRLVRQENRGVSAARNAGLAVSSASFVIFLDADDRLLPSAIETGLRQLQSHPECAFTFGRYAYLIMDGKARKTAENRTVTNAFDGLMRQNFIGPPATVMFRRSALDTLGGFDEGFRSGEDYDLYLRITRRWPIAVHDALVAEYRRHDRNKSGDPERVRRHALMALNKQLPFGPEELARQAAYRAGVQNCHIWFAKQLAARAWFAMRSKRWLDAARALWCALRKVPLSAAPYVFLAIVRDTTRRLRRSYG